MKTISIFDFVPQLMKELTQLDHLLGKALGHADHKKYEANHLLHDRLAPDMWPLSRQIQQTCEHAKGFGNFLSNKPAPKFEENETTLAQFRERTQKTITYLKSLNPEDFHDWENKKVELRWNPGNYLSAYDYVMHYQIPNFYFHLTMTYAILRTNGMDIGKGDFLGALAFHKIQ